MHLTFEWLPPADSANLPHKRAPPVSVRLAGCDVDIDRAFITEKIKVVQNEKRKKTTWVFVFQILKRFAGTFHQA